MITMIHCAEEVTPQVLTSLLQRAGILPSGGTVESVACQPVNTGEFGKGHPLYFLTAQYAGLQNTLPPNRLFLKFGKSPKEDFFYTQIAPGFDSLLLLKCYYSGYDAQSDTTCLLLEDLSATHFQTEWPLPPSDAQCVQTVERLAEIHARFWEHPRLEFEFRRALPRGRSWADRNVLAMEKLPAFLDFMGDRLSPHRRGIYDQVLNSSHLWQALPGAPNLTLVHGDMHFWNVFFPKDPMQDHLRFFDWNMWDIGRATDDLAYLLALHWYPERRARMENDLLDAYVHRLGGCGITGYTQDELRCDYRISVIRSLLIPIWQWVRGIHPAVWWSHLERGMLAFEDLGCQDLLAV